MSNHLLTLGSGINVGSVIRVGVGRFGKKQKNVGSGIIVGARKRIKHIFENEQKDEYRLGCPKS